jgi:type I restriction enzyme S subunit
MQTLNAAQKTKKTAAGRIPVDWEAINLGDYLREISVRNSPVNPNLPVLSVTNTQGFVTSESYFDRKVYSKDLSNYKIVHQDQFAYNPSRINVGSIAQLKSFEKGCLSPMYVVFEAQKGLDADYLAYWIQSGRFGNLIESSTQGTVRDSVNFSALAGFPFALPPVDEQKKITTILFCVDDCISKTQAVIEQTQFLKKALMQELFTRGLPGKNKKLKKTKIGEIPMNWEVKSISDLLVFCQYGLNHPLSSDPVGTPILRMNNISETGLNFSDLKYAVLSKEEEKEYILQDGDLLFNRTNSPALVGKVALFYGIKNMSFASYLLRLRVDPNKANPRWLNYFFNRDEIQAKLRYLATPGVSQSNINATLMQSIELGVPSIEEQNEISGTIDSLVQRADIEIAAFDKLKYLKSALMQVLLTGEMRVKGV